MFIDWIMSSVEEICKNIDELINQKADRNEMFEIMEKAYEKYPGIEICFFD